MNMKRIMGALFCLVFMTLAQAQEVKLTNKADSISYALGMDIGTSLGRTGMEIDTDQLHQGILDAINGSEKFSAEQKMALIQSFQQQAQAKQQAVQQEKAALALKEGELFLAENRKVSGVIETESGLQYTVLKEGSGASPSASDVVKVHYEGKLLNETIFDSSYQRGEPIEFQLDRVIKGWTEGVQLMRVGAKYRFFIPAALGYGERGAGPTIGPNETLVFDVELLEVKRQ